MSVGRGSRSSVGDLFDEGAGQRRERNGQGRADGIRHTRSNADSRAFFSRGFGSTSGEEEKEEGGGGGGEGQRGSPWHFPRDAVRYCARAILFLSGSARSFPHDFPFRQARHTREGCRNWLRVIAGARARPRVGKSALDVKSCTRCAEGRDARCHDTCVTERPYAASVERGKRKREKEKGRRAMGDSRLSFVVALGCARVCAPMCT